MKIITILDSKSVWGRAWDNSQMYVPLLDTLLADNMDQVLELVNDTIGIAATDTDGVITITGVAAYVQYILLTATDTIARDPITITNYTDAIGMYYITQSYNNKRDDIGLAGDVYNLYNNSRIATIQLQQIQYCDETTIAQQLAIIN